MNHKTLLFTLAILLSLLLAGCGAADTVGEPQPVDELAQESTEAEAAATAEIDLAGDADRPDFGQPTATPQSFAGRVPAPEFPAGLDWLNSEQPLTMEDLRGKIVLLDFWTYGCINCIHIIPDLKRLEEKYAQELVVIGVHSAKFENESETENIRRIILRYELEHPVVNDNQFQIWNEYGARAWPTLVLIDPDGKVLGYHSGEGVYDPFDEVIGKMIAEFDPQGKIDRTPLDLKLEQDNQVRSPLRFPGKVLADAENNRLFIADSNHNRIVITDLAGNVLDVAGSGLAALEDGSFESAAFNKPQGLTLANENILYVADTENHTIRRLNLAQRTVETVAGTGQQVYTRIQLGNALTTPLNSPWDVLYVNGLVYIAMAGQHQLWALDVAADTVLLHAGSGLEELADGPLVQGGLNQPSGLATDGELIYIADSEASAIRTADLALNGELNTIVGTGLFDFGDVDGQGDEVRLQHPLGVAYRDGLLYVADTYNSKIKLIDPETRGSQTLLGGAESGWRDGSEPLFDEPGGLSIAGNTLYIADTNNQVIRLADLDSGEVSTLVLIDSQGLLTRQPPDADYAGTVIGLNPQTVAPGQGTIRLDVTFPDGYKANDLAPFSMAWTVDGEAVSVDNDAANRSIVEPAFPLSFPAEFSPGSSQVTADLVIYYCEAVAQSLCFIEQVRITIPITVAEGGAQELVVRHEVPGPG